MYCCDLSRHYYQVVDRLSCTSTGVQAYADALLIIPKVLAQNSGLDAQDTIVKLQEEYVTVGQPVGLDIVTGEYSVLFSSGLWSPQWTLMVLRHHLASSFLVPPF